MADVSQETQNSAWRSNAAEAALWAKSRIKNSALMIWSAVAKTSFMLFVFVIGIAAWLGLRPDTDVTDDFLPKRWNDSIIRLGIAPVYPPQEDIYVGDLILQVVDSGYEFKETQKNLVESPDAFIGKYIKIGQLDDVRKYFSKTAFSPDLGISEWNNGNLALNQPRLENKPDISEDGIVVLKDVLFPIIKIEKNNTILGVLSKINIFSDFNHSEEIELEKVQTYSANPLRIYSALANFCKENDNYCEDKSARKILSYVLNRDILLKDCTVSGRHRYIYDVKIMAIRQVFTARGLQFRNKKGVENILTTGEGNSGLETMGSRENTVSDTAGNPADSVDKKRTTVRAIDGRSNALQNETGSGLFSTQKFARPLVIGFNAVSFGMRNSSPAWIEENIALGRKNNSVQNAAQTQEDAECQS